MTQPVRAVCQDCEKVYRVPDAGRTYKCKACGGSVSAAVAAPEEPEPEPAPEKPRKRPASARRSASGKVSEDAEKRWSARERFARKKKSKTPLWIGLGVGVAAIAFGLWYIQPGRGGEPDINKVAASFVDAWEAEDVGAIAGMHHPTGKAEFRERLDAVAAGRWKDGAPKITKTAAIEQDEAGREAGTVDVAKAITAHQLEGGAISISWQFDEPRQRWYIYDFALPPPPIEDRLEAFGAAWSKSSPSALEPFFAPGSGEKMAALVEREAKKRDWTGSFPALGEPSLDPTPEQLARASGFGMAQKLDAQFDDLLVRWKVHEASDSWCISGFKFP